MRAGIIDDVNGAVFSGKTCSLRYAGANSSLCGNPIDTVGHGTKISGVIAAQANCLGIVGAGPGLKVMVLKVRRACLCFVCAEATHGSARRAPPLPDKVTSHMHALGHQTPRQSCAPCGGWSACGA